MSEAVTMNRGCPVCRLADAAPLLVKGELRVVQCRACGMSYASPVAAVLASGSYYDGIATYYLSPAKLESDYAGVRFERELKLFRRRCITGAVLDVGCSSGAFLFQLGSRFPGQYELIGTDASGPALDYAESRGVKVVRGDFLEQDFQGKKFDAITFWAVLEHLAEPDRFLEKAAALLKPTGVCFVLVPNMCSLAVRLLGVRYRYFYPQHLNYFTAETLGRLVAGRFEVRECRSMHFNPVVIWQDWRHRGAEVSNQERAELLRRTTGYKQNPLLKPARGLYALVEKGLGKVMLADNLVMVLRQKR
jgi:SAM-dependent methyltransferase